MSRLVSPLVFAGVWGLVPPSMNIRNKIIEFFVYIVTVDGYDSEITAHRSRRLIPIERLQVSNICEITLGIRSAEVYTICEVQAKCLTKYAATAIELSAADGTTPTAL